jgi:RimJ/RimL family protein N-acetyltransferase
MLHIRRLFVGDESVLRKIRLRALLDSPNAFGSTYEREFAFVDADWQKRLARNDAATFVCDQDDGIAIGLVTGAIDEDISTITWLLSMWVDPMMRGNRVAGQLIDEVLAWTKLQKCTSIRLQVTEGNTSAERAYKKCGFRRTGNTILRERDNVTEFEMDLNLD